MAYKVYYIHNPSSIQSVHSPLVFFNSLVRFLFRDCISSRIPLQTSAKFSSSSVHRKEANNSPMPTSSSSSASVSSTDSSSLTTKSSSCSSSFIVFSFSLGIYHSMVFFFAHSERISLALPLPTDDESASRDGWTMEQCGICDIPGAYVAPEVEK